MLSPGVTPLLRSDPRSIGRYRILGRLGAGGMATVYLAEADGFVAVKLVHQHLAADEEFRARFSREVELAARVPPHCTAELRDRGVHDDRPYLVTEYLSGSALHHLVENEGPLDPSSLHNVAVGLAAGLTAIHDCDLVHRDIKPSNVIVTLGGVRIIDFGIARTLDTTTDFTRTGVVMGSLGWTSPEQLDAREPTPAMDVFAWGCVVAYAATGRHPFGGDDTASRSWRILNAEPALDGIPDPVADLVRAALDRDTERRPTAQELLLGLVGGSGPVVKVRAARPPQRPGGTPTGSPAGNDDPTVRSPRRKRFVFLAAGIPVGLALAVTLSSAAGGPFRFGADPTESRRGVPASTGPAVPGSPDGRAGDEYGPDGTDDGGHGASAPDTETADGPTLTPAPDGTESAESAESAEVDEDDPGNGAAGSKSKKPKKSKKPDD